jgi:speckle-type POZ protein
MFIENAQESSYAITDISKEVFTELLRFIYCGRLQNLENIAMDLLKAADRFGLEKLKEICESQLLNGVNNDTAQEMFQLAHRMDLARLMQVSFELIQK